MKLYPKNVYVSWVQMIVTKGFVSDNQPTPLLSSFVRNQIADKIRSVISPIRHANDSLLRKLGG